MADGSLSDLRPNLLPLTYVLCARMPSGLWAGGLLRMCVCARVIYTKAGNRRAACVTAAEAYREAPLEQIDSLIACYGDLQEAGELAIVKYHHLAKTLGDSDADVAAKVDYLQKALNRWGNWKRINILRNAMVRLTRPSYHVDIEHEVWLPQRAQKVSLKKIRNVSSLTMTVYRTKADGDFK